MVVIYSNTTTASLFVGSYYAYVVEGAILLFFNLYLALVIFFTKRLRSQKEYVVIASNMMFDATFGLEKEINKDDINSSAD
uniref:Uncharacterized protein n=1 Tax=Acrobeloides nanus TaxID=290746 RepID=A0A914DBJ8_9BILA